MTIISLDMLYSKRNDRWGQIDEALLYLLLKPEVAASYFGKEKLIYQLFLKGETANKELKKLFISKSTIS
ncbi:hypothetical protein KHA80_20435 [Anaerobacillus sp. HL2]|nr:hypothetical protein KHA80_20435 [Anaerobacillus sp. HL2]